MWPNPTSHDTASGFGSWVCSWYSSRCRVLGHKSRTLRSVSTGACVTLNFVSGFDWKMPSLPLEALWCKAARPVMSSIKTGHRSATSALSSSTEILFSVSRCCTLLSFIRSFYVSVFSYFIYFPSFLLASITPSSIFRDLTFVSLVWPLLCLFNFLSQLSWSVCRRQAAEKSRVSHPPVYQFNLSWNHLTTWENFTHTNQVGCEMWQNILLMQRSASLCQAWKKNNNR